MAGAKVAKLNWATSAMMHGYTRPGTSGRGTGEMIEKIGWSENAAKKIGDGHSIDIYPQGSRKRGKQTTRNAEIAYMLNYGWGGRAGDGWAEEAHEDSDTEVWPAMQAKLDEIVQRGTGE